MLGLIGIAPRISIPLRYNLETFATSVMTSHLSDFNSTKVQFGEVKIDQVIAVYNISIPLRYNLEE